MSRIYITLLVIATVLVSITGAYFSVKGLMELFAGAQLSVAIMSSALEFSKFVTVGVVYRYWGHIHRPLRVYLIFAIATLMLITSVGIYGYLSNAYQTAALDTHTHLMEITALEKQNERVLAQIEEVKDFVNKIPASNITKRLNYQKQNEMKLDILRDQSEMIISEIDSKNRELLKFNVKAGPAAHLARFLGVSMDTAVNTLILIFVLVFDPLAVSLVFCLNLLIRLREKYRGNEYRIGSHSLTTPVDHRFRKAG